MASLRKKGATWYACIALPGGKRTQVSTKKRDVGTPAERADLRRQAMLIAQALEEATMGDPTEVQIRQTLDMLFARVGKPGRVSTPAHEFIGEWLQRTKLHKALGTFTRYSCIAKGFLASLGARQSTALADIRVRDVQAWLDAELASGKRLSTIIVARQTLGIPFAKAFKQGLISVNPVDQTELPHYSRRAGRLPFTGAQLAAIVATAEGDWRTATLLGALTGARLGDACNMRWAAVDLLNGIVCFVPGKTRRTGAEVMIPLHPALNAHLKALRAQQPEECEFLCPSLANRRVGGTDGLSTKYKRLLQRAGIQTEQPVSGAAGPAKPTKGHKISRYSFHSLRHSFATLLANAGVAREIRMKLVGHATEQIHDRYTHLALETLRGAVLQLPAFEIAPAGIANTDLPRPAHSPIETRPDDNAPRAPTQPSIQ